MNSKAEPMVVGALNEITNPFSFQIVKFYFAVVLMLEPGRSLVADACALVTRVLGVKSNGGALARLFICIFSNLCCGALVCINFF